MSVELRNLRKFIFSFDHMTSGFQCPSVYRQTRYTTNSTEGGGLTMEHCSIYQYYEESTLFITFIVNYSYILFKSNICKKNKLLGILIYFKIVIFI